MAEPLNSIPSMKRKEMKEGGWEGEREGRKKRKREGRRQIILSHYITVGQMEEWKC